MKKSLITIITLVLMAAVSLTAFLIIKNKEDGKKTAEAEKNADYALFNFDSDSINKVTFDCPDGVYTAEHIDNKWTLTNSDEFTISESYVQNICEYMCTLSATKDYGDADDEKKSVYGLENPVKITAYSDTDEYTIFVGDPSPTGDIYYVMIGNKSKIYAIDSLYSSIFKTSRIMMKDKYLVPYTDDEMSEIKLVKNGSTVFDLTYNEDTSSWDLPEEYSKLTIDATKITTMINVMTRLEVESFLDENLEDYSKYGFDTPEAELIVTGKDGKTQKLLFSYYGNNAANYTHILFEETGQVATFYTSDVDFIEYTPLHFLSSTINSVYTTDITGFDFKFDDMSSSFIVNITDSIITCDGSSLSDTQKNSITIFNNFFSAITNLKFSDLELEAAPDNSEPFMSVKYFFPDGTKKLIEFSSEVDAKHYVFIDGEYTGTYIEHSALTGQNSVKEFYGKLLESLTAE